MNTNAGLTCVHLTDPKPYPTAPDVISLGFAIMRRAIDNAKN